MSELWTGITFLHVVSMAFFVGGQLVVAAALVPVERSNPDPERMRSVARRFGYGSLVALAVLLATGVAMAEHFSLWDSSTLQTKLGLVVLVIGLTVAHIRFPKAHALQAVTFAASLAIVWLGLSLSH